FIGYVAGCAPAVPEVEAVAGDVDMEPGFSGSFYVCFYFFGGKKVAGGLGGFDGGGEAVFFGGGGSGFDGRVQVNPDVIGMMGVLPAGGPGVYVHAAVIDQV